MAVFQSTLYSDVLTMDTQVFVTIPDRKQEGKGRPDKVIYLLHGLGHNAAQWMRETRAEYYAQQYGFALVMPEVQRSFYTDMAYGANYFTYITEELPFLLMHFFGLCFSPAHCFVAGLSMGGYGALKIGLTFPERFAGCASFAGAVDMRFLLEKQKQTFTPQEQREALGLLGESLVLPQQDDLFFLLTQLEKEKPPHLPGLYLACGTEDPFLEMNRQFAKAAEKSLLAPCYQEWPGAHDCLFWDEGLHRAMRYFVGEKLLQNGERRDAGNS